MGLFRRENRIVLDGRSGDWNGSIKHDREEKGWREREHREEKLKLRATCGLVFKHNK